MADVRNGMSLRTRLIITSSAISTLVVVVAAFVVYEAMTVQLVDVVDAALEDRLVDILRNVERSDFDVADEDRLTQVLGIDGTPISTSRSLPKNTVLVEARAIESADASERINMTTMIDGFEHRIRLLAATVDGPEGPRVVVLARSLEAVDAQRRQLLIALLVSAPLVAAMLCFFNLVLARRILHPVQRMSQRAANLDPKNATIDIGATTGRDEFSALAAAFNALLSRISSARTREQRFISNVSHELRTPLSILRGELELLLADADAEARDSIARSIEEVDRMNNLVGRLLVIARNDGGHTMSNPEWTDIGLLLDDVLAGLATTLDNVGWIRVAQVTSEPVWIDGEFVRQILINLLTNAVRHARSAVDVVISVEQQTLHLRVADDGEGFGVLVGEAALQPFTRGEAHGVDGNTPHRFGLGLAIVESLVSVSDGTTAVSDDPKGGGIVDITIPVIPT